MKALLLLFPAMLSAQYVSVGSAVNSHAGGGGPTYTYSRQLTIDRTKCGTSNLTNFPVLVSISDTTMKITGSGGRIQHSTTQASGPAVTMPADLIFTSDSLGATPIPWEIESWDSTGGVLVAWVLVGTVNGSAAGSNTSFYVFYDAAAVSTPQNTGSNVPANVWAANYAAVNHMGNGASISLAASAGGSNGTNSGGTATAGIVGTAGAYGGTPNFASVPIDLSAASVITVEYWLKWTTNANDDDLAMEFTANGNANNGAFIIDHDASAPGNQVEYGPSKFSGSATYWHDQIARPTAAVWHHYAYVMDRSTPSNLAYVDGVAVSNTANINHNATAMGNYANSTLYLMSRGGASLIGAGVLDELRVGTVARSADWVKDSYANQNAPGNIGANNFIIFGVEVTN